MRGIALAVMLCGCGRIAFDVASPDAACTGPFQMPVFLPGALNTPTQTEWHPWISASGLNLYLYITSATTGHDIAVASRGSIAETFGEPLVIPELATANREANPTLTAYERTIVFDVTLGTQSDFYIATRADATMPFSPPQPLAELNTTGSEISASLTPDGLELFFVRELNGNEVHHAVRGDVSQPFTDSELVDLRVTGYRNHHVSISPDALDLYVSSDRPGSLGKFDAFVMHRATRSSPFGPLEHLPQLASAGDDGIDSVSADGATAYMFFNSDLAALTDVWITTRACQ